MKRDAVDRRLKKLASRCIQHANQALTEMRLLLGDDQVTRWLAREMDVQEERLVSAHRALGLKIEAEDRPADELALDLQERDMEIERLRDALGEIVDAMSLAPAREIARSALGIVPEIKVGDVLLGEADGDPTRLQ
jgi:hypothetical protein